MRASSSALVAASRYLKAESSAASAALLCRAPVHGADRLYLRKTVLFRMQRKRCGWRHHSGAILKSDGSNHGRRLRRGTSPAHQSCSATWWVQGPLQERQKSPATLTLLDEAFGALEFVLVTGARAIWNVRITFVIDVAVYLRRDGAGLCGRVFATSGIQVRCHISAACNHIFHGASASKSGIAPASVEADGPEVFPVKPRGIAMGAMGDLSCCFQRSMS